LHSCIFFVRILCIIMKSNILLILILSFGISLSAQAFKCLGADFEKINTERAVSDTTRGKIYFQLPSTMHIKVEYPVNQLLTYDKDKFLIYYPESEQAFALYSSNPMNIPFFSSIISVVKEDFGLSDLGFTMSSNVIKGDTLVAEWAPPEALKPVISKIRITYDKQKLILSQTFDAKNQMVVYTAYENHFEYKGYYFPLSVTTHQIIGTSDNIEQIIYTNPQFELDFPKIARQFKIPKEVQIKELNW